MQATAALSLETSLHQHPVSPGSVQPVPKTSRTGWAPRWHLGQDAASLHQSTHIHWTLISDISVGIPVQQFVRSVAGTPTRCLNLPETGTTLADQRQRAEILMSLHGCGNLREGARGRRRQSRKTVRTAHFPSRNPPPRSRLTERTRLAPAHEIRTWCGGGGATALVPAKLSLMGGTTTGSVTPGSGFGDAALQSVAAPCR